MSCHSRKSTGIINNMNGGSVPFRSASASGFLLGRLPCGDVEVLQWGCEWLG